MRRFVACAVFRQKTRISERSAFVGYHEINEKTRNVKFNVFTAVAEAAVVIENKFKRFSF